MVVGGVLTKAVGVSVGSTVWSGEPSKDGFIYI